MMRASPSCAAAPTYSYSCVDKCRATPMVGDAPSHFQDVMTTVTGKQQTAKGQQ